MGEDFENLLPHAVEIIGTMNKGYIMQVGCARFAFGDPDEMLELLKKYLDDPEGMVEKYNKAMSKHGGAPRLVGRSEDQCETESEPQQPEGNI